MYIKIGGVWRAHSTEPVLGVLSFASDEVCEEKGHEIASFTQLKTHCLKDVVTTVKMEEIPPELDLN